MEKQIDRRNFMKNGAAAGLGAALAGAAFSGCAESSARPGRAVMLTHGSSPKEVIKIGFVGIGNMGSVHVANLLEVAGCQITAVCDIRPERTDWAKRRIAKAGFAEPAVYNSGETDFERMCQEADLDLVYNAAPWHWHTPICLAAMKNGKHAASEVNIALSVEDCWKLVETSEKTRKHCVMMENCCYDQVEMMTLNMIKKGLFGQILHGECGYLHDLRELKLSPTYYQGMWRLHESIRRNGNLYPTHGIGPMAWCMDINRGDTLDYLVSLSSSGLGLTEYAKEHYPSSPWVNQTFALGDVNACLIRTKKGKTIICKHDTNLPRPYSRDFLVQGTKGLTRKYPDSYIYVEGRSKPHEWETSDAYQEEFEHPIWQDLNKKIEDGLTPDGHGGMDYIEDYRLIQALRKGLTPDIDVYDSVLWSSIIPLSEESVAKNGAPVKFPDFTRGAWQKPRPLGVDTIL
ncbi:MAG: Gfo/Idh/MocA family oxidoreductase [Planctomycetales bacterium]|nr:Gfo/Idh/MocA family oxidoreductase [Planctomycetales bacterium]